MEHLETICFPLAWFNFCSFKCQLSSYFKNVGKEHMKPHEPYLSTPFSRVFQKVTWTQKALVSVSLNLRKCVCLPLSKRLDTTSNNKACRQGSKLSQHGSYFKPFKICLSDLKLKWCLNKKKINLNWNS